MIIGRLALHRKWRNYCEKREIYFFILIVNNDDYPSQFFTISMNQIQNFYPFIFLLYNNIKY